METKDPMVAPLLGQAEGAPPPYDSSTKFRYGKREYKDVYWIPFFGLCMLACIVMGIYGVANRNPSFDDNVHEYWACHPNESPNRPPSPEGSSSSGGSPTKFILAVAGQIAGTMAACCVLGIIMLLLFQNHARVMVYTMAVGEVLLFVVCAVLSFIYFNSVWLAIMCGVVALILVLFYYIWRSYLDLCARLLSASARGLKENFGLFPLAVGCLFSGIVVQAGIFALGVVSMENGEVIPMEAAVFNNATGLCFKDYYEVDCCEWQQSSWVTGYLAFAGVMLIWIGALAMEVRHYVVGATICQWYYNIDSTTTGHGRIKLSLTYALTTSFGTICFASLIMTLIELLRMMINDSKKKSQSIWIICLQIIAECILKFLEFLTNLATLMSAMKGDSLITSGKNVVSIFKRHLLSAYAVWRFPKSVMLFFSLILSLAWGATIYIISYEAWKHSPPGGFEDDDVRSLSIIIGVICGLIALFVFSFFSHIMLSVVDTIYLCYIQDKDQQSMNASPEIQAVFDAVILTQKPKNDRRGQATISQ